MISDDIIPRLRSLAQTRGFTRSAMCNYLGLHTNSLWRIDDDEWSPRLDTVRKIQHFVRRFERSKTKHLSGHGWRLDHKDGAWWIVASGERLGPYSDPDTALVAGQQLKTASPAAKTKQSSQETCL